MSDSDGELDIAKALSLFEQPLSVLLDPRRSENLDEEEIEELNIDSLVSQSRIKQKDSTTMKPKNCNKIKSKSSNKTEKKLQTKSRPSDKSFWLKNKHINAAMALLRVKFPEIGALYNTEFIAHPNATLPLLETKKWLQIVNISNSRWVLTANGFNNVDHITVYDSLNATGKRKVSEPIIHSVARFMKTSDQSFQIGNMPCQGQEDSYNCGVFSIAFATALAFGQNPSNITMNAKVMRMHLIECLKQKTITPFPYVSNQKVLKKFPQSTTVELYCFCRMPWPKGAVKKSLDDSV